MYGHSANAHMALYICVKLALKHFVNCKRSVQAIYGNPSHNYGVSLAVWDHTVLPYTQWRRQL